MGRKRRRSGRRRSGFTLIELLTVVAVMGLVAAFLIPHLLDSLNKARQRRTVADIRNVGLGWFAWLTDGAPGAAAGASQYDYAALEEVSPDELRALLVSPTGVRYTSKVPDVDYWGNDLDYGWARSGSDTTTIAIRSLGQDGEVGPTPNPYPYGGFIVTDYKEDIVWADGFFIRYPTGVVAAGQDP